MRGKRSSRRKSRSSRRRGRRRSSSSSSSSIGSSDSSIKVTFSCRSVLGNLKLFFPFILVFYHPLSPCALVL